MNATPVAAAVELDDIQGLLRFGYKRHTEAAFLLLRVRDREAARSWLAAVRLTTAVAVDPLPATVLQLALTSPGLRALGVPATIVDAFSSEFVSGMGSDASRARRLGDVGTNDPACWRWGTGERVPHLLLLLYALPGRLSAWQQQVEAECATGFERLACLATADIQGREPFGFVDGISQPQLDWTRERPARDAQQACYDNRSCLGEYLLGYPNEYGGYTDRPLLRPIDAPSLARAEDAPEQADLGRNGSYLVLRQLRTDVAAFWQFVDRRAGGDAVRRESLAAAMVGRTRGGEPVVVSPADRPEADVAQPDLNAFDYRADPRGLRCPLGAHVRRSNPRNADLPPGAPSWLSWLKRTLGLDAQALAQDLVAPTRFHRLLRRGRKYGAALTIEQALQVAPGSVDVGLHFICLGANVARQFEFVQSAWLASTHFDGLHHESDPLVGTRTCMPDGTPTDAFSMPQASGADQRMNGLPQFVNVLGGAYFFLPGIRALRYLATAR